MGRLPLLSTPPPIAIADEPLEAAAPPPPAGAAGSTAGLEVVPPWQARSPRRVRRLSVAPIVIALVVTIVVVTGRGHDAQALRERPARQSTTQSVPRQPLIVSAPADEPTDATRPAP